VSDAVPAKAMVWVTTVPAAGVATLSVGAVASRVRVSVVTVPAVPPTLGVTVTVLLPSPVDSVIGADQVVKAAVGLSRVAWTVVPSTVAAIAFVPAAVKRA